MRKYCAHKTFHSANEFANAELLVLNVLLTAADMFMISTPLPVLAGSTQILQTKSSRTWYKTELHGCTDSSGKLSRYL